MRLMRCLSIILSIIILTSILGVMSAYAKDIIIKDIPATDDSYNVVKWVISEQYMSLALGKFLPAKYVKRSEFAAIVTKMTGSGTALQNPKKPTFQDVTVKNQFYKQIETAKTYMISFRSKTAKLFKPNSNLTREDAMYSIVKVLGYDTDEAVGSNDNMDLRLEDIIEDADSISPAIVKYVSVGISYELMDLRTNQDMLYFDSKKSITRMDMATLIYNAYQRKNYTVEEIVIENEDSNSSDNTDKSPQGNTEKQDLNKDTSNGGKAGIQAINPGTNGTVQKLDEPLIYVGPHLNYDSIWLTKIEPLGKLQDGKETTIVIEAEYSLVTQDKALFSIYFNNSEANTWKNKDELRENFVCEVPGGTGKYRFTIPVKVKRWDDVTPFYFIMRLRNGYTELSHTTNKFLRIE